MSFTPEYLPSFSIFAFSYESGGIFGVGGLQAESDALALDPEAKKAGEEIKATSDEIGQERGI